MRRRLEEMQAHEVPTPLTPPGTRAPGVTVSAAAHSALLLQRSVPVAATASISSSRLCPPPALVAAELLAAARFAADCTLPTAGVTGLIRIIGALTARGCTAAATLLPANQWPRRRLCSGVAARTFATSAAYRKDAQHSRRWATAVDDSEQHPQDEPNRPGHMHRRTGLRDAHPACHCRSTRHRVHRAGADGRLDVRGADASVQARRPHPSDPRPLYARDKPR